jgi:hypothetical protein
VNNQQNQSPRGSPWKLNSEGEAILTFAAGAMIGGPLGGIVALLVNPPSIGDNSSPPAVSQAVTTEATGTALSALIPIPGAGKAASSELIAAARAAGRAGEQAVGTTAKKEAIESITQTAERRIPDAIHHTTKTLADVKNRAHVSLTNQMKDFIACAKKGYKLELKVRIGEGTTLSCTLKEALKGIEHSIDKVI